MPRRAQAGVRPLDPDSLHASRLVQQVINKVMVDGKKSTAERIVYDALDTLSRRSNKEPVEALEASIKSLTPSLEVRSRRVGGATYQVPVEVPARRARTLAVRWLVEFARNRREKTMSERLAGELLEAQSEQGGAYKRKEDIYRMAQANKAFAHYRWSLGGCKPSPGCVIGPSRAEHASRPVPLPCSVSHPAASGSLGRSAGCYGVPRNRAQGGASDARSGCSGRRRAPEGRAPSLRASPPARTARIPPAISR
jgi:small subunit ribosomal protein S7